MRLPYYQQSVGKVIDNIERLDDEKLEYSYKMAVYGTLYAMDMASPRRGRQKMWEKRQQRMLDSACTLASRLGDKVDSLEPKILDDIENQRYCFNGVGNSTEAKKNVYTVLSSTTLYSVGGKVDLEGSVERKLPSLRKDGKGGYRFRGCRICKDGSGWIIYEHCSEFHYDHSGSFRDRDDAVAWATRNYHDRRVTAVVDEHYRNDPEYFIPVTKSKAEKIRVDTLGEAKQWLAENVEVHARYA